MDLNRLLFIGIGQCGNNIIDEFDKCGYNTFAINTSELDLKGLNVENKYIIPGASGCARDRKKALGYLKNNHNKIFKSIENKFKEQDIVYVVFSLGGGTGSGMSPLIIDAISRKYNDKFIGAIVVVPSMEESMQTKINAVEAYNDLINIPNLRSVFIVDNNHSKDKISLNKSLVKKFDTIANIAKPDIRGVVDGCELEKLLTCKGNSVILEFEEHDGLLRYADNIFIDNNKDCEFIGMTTVGDFDVSVLENEFGKPSDVFRGYNNKNNVLIACGMSYSTNYFRLLDEDIRRYSEESRKVNEVVSSNKKVEVIDTSDYRRVDLSNVNVEELNFDELFESYK